MNGIELFFMDIWTFVFSQLGLVAIGFILRGWRDRRVSAKSAKL